MRGIEGTQFKHANAAWRMLPVALTLFIAITTAAAQPQGSVWGFHAVPEGVYAVGDWIEAWGWAYASVHIDAWRAGWDFSAIAVIALDVERLILLDDREVSMGAGFGNVVLDSWAVTWWWAGRFLEPDDVGGPYRSYGLHSAEFLGRVEGFPEEGRKDEGETQTHYWVVDKGDAPVESGLSE